MSEGLGMRYTTGPEPKDPQEADEWHETYQGLVFTDEAYVSELATGSSSNSHSSLSIFQTSRTLRVHP